MGDGIPKKEIFDGLHKDVMGAFWMMELPKKEILMAYVSDLFCSKNSKKIIKITKKGNFDGLCKQF